MSRFSCEVGEAPGRAAQGIAMVVVVAGMRRIELEKACGALVVSRSA